MLLGNSQPLINLDDDHHHLDLDHLDDDDHDDHLDDDVQNKVPYLSKYQQV